MTTTLPAHAPPPPPRERRALLTLAPVLLGVIALPMSLTSVSVALPDIGRDLGSSVSATQGAITGYNVAFASLMLAAGAAGDQLGRRRLFIAGSALFGLGQLAAALAPTIAILVIGRTLAGVGAATALTTGSALLAARFDGDERARAFGLFGTTLGAGLSLGPVVGGVLSDQLGWPAVFGLLAVLGLAAAVLGATGLDESRDPDATGVDWGGTTTFTAALALLIIGIVGAPDAGWLSARTLLLGAASVALLAAFVRIERQHSHPMLDLSLLTQRRFLGIGVAAMAIVLAFVPLLVNLPTLLSTERGINATAAGALLMFLTVPTLIVPVVAGALVQRLHVKVLVWSGLAMEAVGVWWLAAATFDGALIALAAPLVLIGFGVGIANGVLDGAAVSSVPPARAGMAAGLFNTQRLGAETTAIAVAGSLILSLTHSGRSEPAAMDVTLVVLGAVCLLALAATVPLLRDHVAASDEATVAPSPTVGERLASEPCSTSVA